MNGKFNVESGTGKTFQLFLEDVYNTTANSQGMFLDSSGKVLARRKTLDLVQDPVYKTQFFNEELKNAIEPLTKETRIFLYDESGEINVLKNKPKLLREYSSIVLEVAPEKPLTQVSIVIYEGPIKENVFLNDGSVTMQDDYIPVKPTDVVTKGYADDMLEDFTAINFPLKSFEIFQDGKPLPIGYSYSDNKPAPVIYFKKYKRENAPLVKIVVDPFAIMNNFSDECTFTLQVGYTHFFPEKLKDIRNGDSKYWKLVSEENIYTADVSKVFWKNGYELEFDPNIFEAVLDETNPFEKISIVVKEKGSKASSDEKLYGFDYYKENAEDELELLYNEDDLEKNRTKYLSGVSYFPYDFEKTYELPIQVKIQNNLCDLFRPEAVTLLQVMSKEGEVEKEIPLKPFYHKRIEDDFEFIFNEKIKYTLKTGSLKFLALNLSNEVLYEKEYKLRIESDASEETYRVTSPKGNDIYPVGGYGDFWDSEKVMSEWEPKLRNGVYTPDERENSAICFKVSPIDCYSHATVDIEHDGEMYLKVEGKTGWLSAQEILLPFKTPIKNNDPCAVNNNYYSFGRVVYKTPLFVRIVKASYIRLNSIELS